MTENYVAVSSRVRLARNLFGYAFPCMIRNLPQGRDVLDKISEVLRGTGEFKICKMNELSEERKNSMVESYVISKSLVSNPDGAVAVSRDGLLSVMINEEDHIREQIVIRGLDLYNAYDRINVLDKILNANIKLAYAGNTYFTSCPSNLGTGMRASVMVFLPATAYYGEISDLSVKAAQRGLTVRGALGEGSGADGFLYQVSNEVTYKITCDEIISKVTGFVEDLSKREIYLRKKMFEEDKFSVADDCFRALGVLSSAVLLDYPELSENLAKVKLGVSLGLIKADDYHKLDDLMIAARPYTLRNNFGRDLSEPVMRAAFVRKNIVNIATKNELPLKW